MGRMVAAGLGRIRLTWRSFRLISAVVAAARLGVLMGAAWLCQPVILRRSWCRCLVQRVQICSCRRLCGLRVRRSLTGGCGAWCATPVVAG